jgi:predicted pyridoxine 5'-phosphate oxidase superfamily flavin-nucleotide-binding protein
MPDQHRRFFEALPFVLVGSLDERRAPVATVFTGAPGFVASPDPRTLHIADPAGAAATDPARAALVAGAPFGLLGIELHTRRRNRANGVVAAADAAGLTLAVRQSFGNCPRYIHPRELVAAPAATTTPPLEHFTGLDATAAAAIARADTFFVATAARLDEPTGGVDVSHRGGPAGFVRVSDTTLTIPDYAGNHYFNTLGNLVSHPRAALLFIDFATGDLLHLQGGVEIDWHDAATAALPGAERLWHLHVERGWRRPAAFPLRWTPTPD